VRKTGPVSRVAIDEIPDRVSGPDRALGVQHGGVVGVKIAECAQRFNALMKPGLEAVDRAGRSGVRNGANADADAEDLVRDRCQGTGKRLLCACMEMRTSCITKCD
jgi:hypothetical protein